MESASKVAFRGGRFTLTWKPASAGHLLRFAPSKFGQRKRGQISPSEFRKAGELFIHLRKIPVALEPPNLRVRFRATAGVVADEAGVVLTVEFRAQLVVRFPVRVQHLAIRVIVQFLQQLLVVPAVGFRGCL